jgi:adenylosuccinate synthase
MVDRVIGVVKAYTTAVGAGPFPTELASSESPFLREKGDEYGATTHRPRRCGWYDAAAVNWSIRLAGFTELILTKLDILSGLDHVPIGVSYQTPNQQPIQNPDPTSVESFQPVYEQLPGWSEEISDCRLISELPENAKAYVNVIEQRAGIPISMISNGPHRNAVLQMSRS